MDREILFRGKRTDSGEWVEGYYTKQCDCCGAVYIILHCAQDPDDDNRAYYINPKTVGQYTGLTDKNGKKIFEGDIIKIRNKTRYVFFGVCRYRHTNYGEYAVDLSVKDGSNCEVIGNIHDNPDLIKQEG